MTRVHVPEGFPKVNTDIAPTAVFLVLYLACGITNFIIMRKNNARGHKFIFNQLSMGFCISRIFTCILRLAWTCNIQNQGLALAATIFVAAGVLLLFIINLMFAQRVLRGLHPHLGWHKGLSTAFLVLYALVPLLLVMVITATIQIFNTTTKNIVNIDLDMQRTASSYFLFIAVLPLPITGFALLYPKKSEPDHFGRGSMTLKAAVVLSVSVLLCLGAGFRTATVFISWTPELAAHPPWWNAKWSFYFFNFAIEIIALVMYLTLRIDLLFHIPNGSKGPGSYSINAKLAEKTEDQESDTQSLQRPSSESSSTVGSELQFPIGAHVSEKSQV